MTSSSIDPRSLPDTQAVLALLSTLERHASDAVRDALPETADLSIARAPGRLDVMGGIADYSGSLVLELPVREATHAVVARVPERAIRVVSSSVVGAEARTFEMPLDDLETLASAESYDAALNYFRRSGEHWAGYVAGAFVVLARELEVRFDSGARVLVLSDVPEGKGVSSSAAVEVASMSAIVAAYGLKIAPRDLAILCQKLENLVVGAPCGVMDQMTSACGEADRLLALVCQPAELGDPPQVPPGVAFLGIDSGVRHAVVGADYGTVRTAAFMGYRMVADFAGLGARLVAPGRVEVNDFRWNGYLANLTPEEFRGRFEGLLPETMRGSEFVDRFEGTTDPVTRVDPKRDYPVRSATRHPVLENARVEAFRRTLFGARDVSDFEALGELMYASHASYSACGLGSEATDRVVALVRAAGPARGLFGAKITGGGSGGTVAVLGRVGAEVVIDEIARAYREETGREAYVFAGSSPGAAQFGALRVRREGGRIV